MDYSDNEAFSEMLVDIRTKLTQNLAHSNKKIEIVNKLYNIVDQEVNKLDIDLKHFEREISDKNISYLKSKLIKI